jgi:hypothetical protein
MQNFTEIVDGIPLQEPGTSSTCAVIIAEKRSELIVHALPVIGCVTIVLGSMFVMPKWMRIDSW